MIAYSIGESGQILLLGDAVLMHFLRHRQLRSRQREAGGQLFARFEGSNIIVAEATGPRASDRRTRLSYVPNRRAEQAEIVVRRSEGLHFIGDWHTHPEAVPSPSETDIRSILDCFSRSTHTLNAFVLIVVGQADPPDGLQVSVCNGTGRAILFADHEVPIAGGKSRGPSLAPSRGDPQVVTPPLKATGDLNESLVS